MKDVEVGTQTKNKLLLALKEASIKISNQLYKEE